MDKDTKWLVGNKLSTEISKLKAETDAGVEALANLTEEARAEMRKEMIYAIRSAANVAAQDLALAVKEGTKKMEAFEAKAAKEHARMINDAVDTDAQAQPALGTMVRAKIKKT